MIWQQVSKVVTDLGQPFIDIRHKFVSAVRGISAVTARWKRCVAEANGVLPLVTGRMFVDKFFHGNAKEKVRESEMLGRPSDRKINSVSDYKVRTGINSAGNH